MNEKILTATIDALTSENAALKAALDQKVDIICALQEQARGVDDDRDREPKRDEIVSCLAEERDAAGEIITEADIVDVKALRARIDGLLASNNRFEERARAAERRVAHLQKIIENTGEAMIAMEQKTEKVDRHHAKRLARLERQRKAAVRRADGLRFAIQNGFTKAIMKASGIVDV